MDRFDHAILAEMEADARQSFGAIAERVGLSKTPCWTRVQALERSGAITGYRATVDPHALGLKLNAYVQVTIDFGMHEAFERAVIAHAAILDCYTIAGPGDYLLHVITADIERLDTLLREELCMLPGVNRFSTTICMKKIKHTASITAAAAIL